MAKFAPVYMSGMMDGDSALSLVDDAGGAVKLDGEDLVVGATASSVGTFNVTVRETNTYGAGSPHDTVFEITVTAA